MHDQAERHPLPMTDTLDLIRAARAAQPDWAARPLRERLAILRRARRLIAARSDALADAIGPAPGRPGRTRGESLSAEILPLADACRFLERAAPALLRPQRLGARGRPLWLAGVDATLRREPFGLVLVIAPGNYPLMLAGVQAVQALAAGNAVAWKPGPGDRPLAATFQGLLIEAGLPAALLAVLDDDRAAATAAIAQGVDKLVLTGSATTGAAVLADLAPQLTPAVMELSGSDAVFVLPGADIDRVVRALLFGLRFNGSSTCIAPRRVLAPPALLAQIEPRLRDGLAAIAPVAVPASVIESLRPLLQAAEQAGARLLGTAPERDRPMAPVVVADARPEMTLLQADVFAPLVSLVAVADTDAALAADAQCPYALGASIFGPESAARALAERVRAASVTVNDIIAPTADPRLPIGGRHRSGFGVTRGAEGLLAMTAVKAVSVRRGGAMPHLDPPRADDDALLGALIDLLHGSGLGVRLQALRRLWRARRR